ALRTGLCPAHAGAVGDDPQPGARRGPDPGRVARLLDQAPCPAYPELSTLLRRHAAGTGHAALQAAPPRAGAAGATPGHGGTPCCASLGIPTVASGPSTRTASSCASRSTKKGRSRSCDACNTRGAPMNQPTRDTLAALGLRLADALHALTEELRECRKEHTALRQQVARIQEAVSAAAGRPPGERQAPWRRYGRAPAGSLTLASSAKPPVSTPSCSPPRRKAACVVMCLDTTTRSTGGAASAPAPG